MDQPDDRVREKLARGASEWGGDVVWCSNPGSSIDRLAPDARGAVVIVRRDLSLCGVVALPESRAPSAEEKTALESKIRSELACRVDGDAAKDTGEGKPK